jgi:hypothetical protein
VGEKKDVDVQAAARNAQLMAHAKALQKQSSQHADDGKLEEVRGCVVLL